MHLTKNVIALRLNDVLILSINILHAFYLK